MIHIIGIPDQLVTLASALREIVSLFSIRPFAPDVPIAGWLTIGIAFFTAYTKQINRDRGFFEKWTLFALGTAGILCARFGLGAASPALCAVLVLAIIEAKKAKRLGAAVK